MQSDPQDEQSVLPDSREGEPSKPVEEDAGAPSSHGPAQPPSAPTPEAAPPRMPAPPQMPTGSPPPSAWGSPPPQPAPPGAGSSDIGSAASFGGSATASPDAVPPVGPEGGEPAGVPDSASVQPNVAAAPTPNLGVAPIVQGDWLSSVCPYLTSADGTYRSAAPDEGHRCTAQEPAATLPLAFQERFCLTDRHPRCEMYKFAQETDAAGGIPAERIPPTDPPTPRARLSGGVDPSRPLLATLAGIAGVVIVVLLVVAFMGSCSGDDEPAPVPGEQATEAPAATARPTPASTPGPEATATPAAGAESTPDEAVGGPVFILYEVQPDEALRRISETFGISRNRIRRDNPQLEGLAPADLPGVVIEVPITGDLTLAEVEALPGFAGLASDEEAQADG